MENFSRVMTKNILNRVFLRFVKYTTVVNYVYRVLGSSEPREASIVMMSIGTYSKYSKQ